MCRLQASFVSRSIVELLSVFVRYASASILMVGIATILVCLAGMTLDTGLVSFVVVHAQHNIDIFLIACAGSFAGVFAASFWLPRSSRLGGGAVLLLVGLACYYAFYFGFSSRLYPEAKHGPVCLLFPLAVGGLCGLLVNAAISRRPRAIGPVG
jgi:hypothetical protein